ncbi:MAG: hypothetical protein AAFN07_16875 [Pseudomonadota bacterium]
MNQTTPLYFSLVRPTRLFASIVTLALTLLVAIPANAATMDVLLAGHDLNLTYPNGASVTISFETDGTYTTSSGSSGTWTLNGETLCTVRNADGFNSCGTLASNKALGDVWVSTDGAGNEVTARVIERE